MATRTAGRAPIYRMELVRSIAERLGLDQEGVDDIVQAFLEEVVHRLATGEQVVLRGFGVFEAKEMRERIRRQPATGEEITVAAHRRPVFRPSDPFKERVNADD